MMSFTEMTKEKTDRGGMLLSVCFSKGPEGMNGKRDRKEGVMTWREM